MVIKLALFALLGSSILMAEDFTLDRFFSKELCGKKNKTIDKQIYKICYDTKMKGPKYVGYVLDGSTVNKGNYTKRPSFYTEKNLKKNQRTSNSDFTWSGTDKGHMASHANWDYDKDMKTVKKTYSLANISPQYPVVNRELWFKAEQAERSFAKKYGKVSVLNVALYREPMNILKRIPLYDAIDLDKERKGSSFKPWSEKKKKDYDKKSRKTFKKRIVIPTEYFKMIWNHEHKFKKCYLYTNDKNAVAAGDKLKHHIVSCKKSLNYILSLKD